MSKTPSCPECRARLAEHSREASGWERSPYGDEFADELHRCRQCGAWSLVTFVDRFSGPGEVRVEGPLSAEEAAAQRARIGNSGQRT